MIYGVVGNRYGWTRERVFEVLGTYNITAADTIVSGGALGVDTLAQDYARFVGATCIIYYPNPRVQSPKRFFDRNKLIALHCDILISFDRKVYSGALNTVNHAKRASKRVDIYKK